MQRALALQLSALSWLQAVTVPHLRCSTCIPCNCRNSILHSLYDTHTLVPHMLAILQLRLKTPA